MSLAHKKGWEKRRANGKGASWAKGKKLHYSVWNKGKIIGKRNKNAVPKIDPLVTRNYNLLAKYGISLDHFNNLLKQQENRCAVCGGEAMGKANQFHVDHNHSTGNIRGLLCHFCNIALGMVRDDITHLEKLINYLKQN